MLVACITERARRICLPVDLPVPHDRATLANALTGFGAQLLREVCHPAVIAVFRLAIANADRAPRCYVEERVPPKARLRSLGIGLVVVVVLVIEMYPARQT
jgi:hypothetical protein